MKKPNTRGPIKAMRSLCDNKVVIIKGTRYKLIVTDDGRRMLGFHANVNNQEELLPFPISLEAFFDLTMTNHVEIE